MKEVLKEALASALALWLISTALALGLHAAQDGPSLFEDFKPPLPEGVESISVDLAREAWQRVLFIDAREKVAYEHEHIANAISLSVGQKVDAKTRSLLAAHDTLIIYCEGEDCGASAKVARELVDSGLQKKLRILSGGLPAWRDRGYPMDFQKHK